GLAMLRWGLVPSWADDPSIGNRLINARTEGVADKPSFRGPFRKRRCLIPADGFYEWQSIGGRKQPWLIRRRDHATFAFAGLWDHWYGPKHEPEKRLAEPLETACIITTGANAVLAPLHSRMPVILAPADWDAWLDPHAPWELAETLLRPCPDDALEAAPVSPRVNNVRHDDPSCIAPMDVPPTLL
ncbi:MAG TPA: SOS response-associated peptidase, partial [Azospirillaceae bacterium]|nr:SOS response-associated peptidase [Azospirillaceae bacterium]